MSPLAIPPVLCGLAPLEPEAPAAAASSVPTSSSAPATTLLLLWIRESTGYAPVVSASPAAACSSSPASLRRCLGRRRVNSGRADVAP